jgi:dipeptidyl-peptidase-3
MLMSDKDRDRAREASGPAPGDVGVPVDRPYLLERVEDAAIVQLYADGFERLSPRERVLIWHLSQAAIAGRDIYFDQRHEHSLEMRDVLENILTHGGGGDPGTMAAITAYTKLFWLHSGPYNSLTSRKFTLRCDPGALAAAAQAAAAAGANFPCRPGEPLDDLLRRLEPLFFDPAVDPIVTHKTPGPGADILVSSANNLYSGVSADDLITFHERYALNSRLVKRDGALVEEVYRVGGRYSAYIERIVAHLERAVVYAPPATTRALEALIRFYRTGEMEDRRSYDVAWVADRDATVDTVNGFVEVYLDARGRKGAWEAMVYYVNERKTDAIHRIAEYAQLFEDRMPWDPRYRKPHVTGVTARAVDVVIETGDAGPMTAIGINLPNDQEVRELYGSKSFSLANITEAYERSTPIELRTEFSWDGDEVRRAVEWGAFASELTTNLHEVIGHGSGLVSPSLRVTPEAALHEQYSTIEETRADLVALYFIADPLLVEMGLIAGDQHYEIVRAEYEGYARNALVQLRRIRQGSQIEEDHMRNRQLIVHWLLANTDSIQIARREGKTFYRVADVDGLRAGVGRLLSEVQRIKAEGDYEAARRLVETYGVYFDAALRDEIVERVDRLQLPSYTGFVMPKLEPVTDEHGQVIDARITYPLDLTAQMLEYSAAARDLRPPAASS